MRSTEPPDERLAERVAMVKQQLERRGIRDARVLAAMARVPRHRFVPESMRHAAYEDRALSIGDGQTISQPYMVARACELAEIEPGDRVLDVGAGSGYQAAVLAQLCERVVAIELVEGLAERARRTLDELAMKNVRVVVGDGTRGFVEEAPYQAILVAAGAPLVPEALIDQTALGGRLVIPVGPHALQTMTVLRKTENGVQQKGYDTCVYVPLRGGGGWADAELSE
ncbi:MAG: protein-L-isoaspartate(D-aspartate) O-methyltransferase [Polyangiales bacterium]